jgi:hypothetical protein
MTYRNQDKKTTMPLSLEKAKVLNEGETREVRANINLLKTSKFTVDSLLVLIKLPREGAEFQ